MEHKIDWHISAAVMQTLHQSVRVKRELSQKAKLSFSMLIYSSILINGRKLWALTENM